MKNEKPMVHNEKEDASFWHILFLNIERPRLYQGLMIIILQEFLNVGYLIQNFSAQPDIRKTYSIIPIFVLSLRLKSSLKITQRTEK